MPISYWRYSYMWSEKKLTIEWNLLSNILSARLSTKDVEIVRHSMERKSGVLMTDTRETDCAITLKQLIVIFRSYFQTEHKLKMTYFFVFWSIRNSVYGWIVENKNIIKMMNSISLLIIRKNKNNQNILHFSQQFISWPFLAASAK